MGNTPSVPCGTLSVVGLGLFFVGGGCVSYYLANQQAVGVGLFGLALLVGGGISGFSSAFGKGTVCY